MTHGEPGNGDLSATSKETQVSSYRTKFDHAFQTGKTLLEQNGHQTSTALPGLALQQYTFEGFETALVTLQHPQAFPQGASKAAQKIARAEIEKGNSDNALKALEVAVSTAAKIPPDRDGYGDEREYWNIVDIYASLGRAKETFALLDKISEAAKENTLVSVIQSFAAAGFDEFALQASDKLAEIQGRVDRGVGVIAEQQAERGDVAAWSQTIAVTNEPLNLAYAYRGIATYHFNQGDLTKARALILVANDHAPDTWKSHFLDFALEKLQDAETALTIVQTGTANIGSIEAYADIAAFLLKAGRNEEAVKVTQLAAETADSLVNEHGSNYDWVKPYAQMTVADLYMKAGQEGKGKEIIDAVASDPKVNLFEIANKLARWGKTDAAFYLAPRVAYPISQLVIYGTIVNNLIEQGNNSQAKAILDYAAVTAIYLASQSDADRNKYLISHLSSFAQKYAQVGESEKSRRLFDIARSVAEKVGTNPVGDSERRYLYRGEIEAGDFERSIQTANEITNLLLKFQAYVEIAENLINSGEFFKANRVLSTAEDITTGIEPPGYMGVIAGEPELMLATQYYRLAMLAA